MKPQPATTNVRSSAPDGPLGAQLLDTLPMGIVVLSRDAVVYQNRAAARWTGPLEALDQLATAIRPAASRDALLTQLNTVFERGEPSSLTGVACPASGEPTGPLDIRLIPLPALHEDRVDHVAMTLIERLPPLDTAEESILAQRLASLGRLTARVAHELNNPLDGAIRYINLALKLAPDAEGPRLRQYLSESRTGLLRMVQILGELLQYSRRTDGEFDECDVNEVVEQSIRSNAGAAEANGIVVAADFQSPHMPTARGSKLYQVCCNLIRNAIDAMPSGGRLAITSGVVGDDVVLRFADTGVGLPPDVDRLFEPFFTTKAAGKGTGLGLSICRELVGQMHGTIAAANGEEGGAVFTVRVPRSSFSKPCRLTDPNATRDGGRESS